MKQAMLEAIRAKKRKEMGKVSELGYELAAREGVVGLFKGEDGEYYLAGGEWIKISERKG